MQKSHPEEKLRVGLFARYGTEKFTKSKISIDFLSGGAYTTFSKWKEVLDLLTKVKRLSDFTSGNLLKQILLFAIPVAATSLLQLTFNSADTMMVGRWGGATPDECETALAAVGSCGSITNLIVGLFMGLAVGAGVTVAHDVGSGNQDEIKKTVHTSVVIAAVLGVIVGVAGALLARPLLILMGSPEAVLDQAVPYMVAVFFGIPASMMYNYLASMLRSYGDSSTPLKFLTISGVVNVLLNLVMVLVFKAGALGVGVATAASNWVSAVLVFLYMSRFDGPLKIDIRSLRIDKRKLVKVLLIGLPAGIQGCVFSVSNVIIQSAINSFDKVIIAGNTAAMNLDNFVYNLQNSFYHASITFVGQNIGAGNVKRVKRSVLYCLLLELVVGVVSGTTVYLAGRPLLGIFAPGNEAVISAGMVRLKFVCLPYFLCGVFEVASGALRGLGRSVVSTLCSIFGSCVIRIAYVYTVFAYFGTINVLYLAYPITWIITSLIMYTCLFVSIRKISKRIALGKQSFK